MINELELKKRFFREGDNFDDTTLNDEELNFYFRNLATARTNKVELPILYFDKRNYTIVKGYCNNNFNERSELISRRYFVEYFRQIAVKDNVISKLNSECKITPHQTIKTNITSNSILGNKIAIDGEYDLLPIVQPKNVSKAYEDMIGVIESQDGFFKPEGLTVFREQIDLIHKSETEKIPSSIMALILWYYNIS